MEIETAERVPLGEAAYQRLRADIVSCRLEPGQRLTERAVAAETGFGMAPVRQALTRLDHEGLIRTLPRKGYQVMPLTLKSVQDLFVMWGILGPEIARLGVSGLTPAQQDEIADLIREGDDPARELPVEAEEIQRRVDLANAIFTLLANASGNRYLIDAFDRIKGEVARVWTFVTRAELVHGTRSVKAGPWFRSLSDRDGEGVAEHARQFIEDARRHVLDVLGSWPSVTTAEIQLTPADH